MIDLEDRIGLHTWTVDTTPLADVLRAAREAGYAAVELRYLDYKRCIDAGLTRDQYLDLVRSSGMKVAVMGIENGIIFVRRRRAGALTRVLRSDVHERGGARLRHADDLARPQYADEHQTRG